MIKSLSKAKPLFDYLLRWFDFVFCCTSWNAIKNAFRGGFIDVFYFFCLFSLSGKRIVNREELEWMSGVDEWKNNKNIKEGRSIRSIEHNRFTCSDCMFDIISINNLLHALDMLLYIISNWKAFGQLYQMRLFKLKQ